ncbi:MAG: hypothetical protein JWM53_2507, partial [bacterium]|nr:hypothetical protein [bacterium]
KLYCSPSVNGEVDEFARHDMIDEGLYHDVTIEANFAISLFKHEDGGRVHSWPPMFVVGRIKRSGPGMFKHLMYENWRRQLDDAGIATQLIETIIARTDGRAIEPDQLDWTSGDPSYGLWTVEDRTGETIGAFRMHERVQREVFTLIATRADALGMRFSSHDGGFTINSAHHLQAFVDDTLEFMREREADTALPANDRDAA